MPPPKAPPSRKPAPTAPPPAEAQDKGDAVETTEPDGPPPGVLAQARRGMQHGEATLVYDKSKGRARAPAPESPRLVVTAGPRKGTEHALVEERTTIGRGSDNVLVIPDISVSRQHSRLEKQGGRWVVLDQGSGNGTRVNGKPIDRFPLQSGDEIEMGDTRLKFVEPGGVLVKGRKLAPAAIMEVAGNARPASQPAFRRRAPIYLALAAALAIVFAAGMVRQKRAAQAAAAAAAQGEENREFARKRFQEGVALLKAGKWVEARDKLKIAAELDSEDLEIARYLESARNEAPRAQQLAIARAALQQKDYPGARDALAGVPDDSALAGSAHELSQELRAALDGAVREARAKVESGDALTAQALLDPVLAAEPSRPDALAVKEAIAGQKRAAAPPPDRRRERAVSSAPARPAPEVQGILEAYLAGDIGAAIERAGQAHSPRAERLFEDLKSFDAAYRDGLAKRQANRTADAVRALDQAAAADRGISQGRDGRLGREVRKALSALHTQLAAAQEGSDEGLPQAAEHLRAAVQNDPGNDAAQAQLRQVADRAKEIYLRGYVSKDEDVEVARQSFKLVIATLPPSDDTAQKARRWLDKLDGKFSKDE